MSKIKSSGILFILVICSSYGSVQALSPGCHCLDSNHVTYVCNGTFAHFQLNITMCPAAEAVYIMSDDPEVCASCDFYHRAFPGKPIEISVSFLTTCGYLPHCCRDVRLLGCALSRCGTSEKVKVKLNSRNIFVLDNTTNSTAPQSTPLTQTMPSLPDTASTVSKVARTRGFSSTILFTMSLLTLSSIANTVSPQLSTIPMTSTTTPMTTSATPKVATTMTLIITPMAATTTAMTSTEIPVTTITKTVPPVRVTTTKPHVVANTTELATTTVLDSTTAAPPNSPSALGTTKRLTTSYVRTLPRVASTSTASGGLEIERVGIGSVVAVLVLTGAVIMIIWRYRRNNDPTASESIVHRGK